MILALRELSQSIGVKKASCTGLSNAQGLVLHFSVFFSLFTGLHAQRECHFQTQRSCSETYVIIRTRLTCQCPVLLEPIRVISPFPLSEASVQVIVRWDFPVFTINSALVIPGSSRRQLSTACSKSLIRSFIWPFPWPDNGDLFRSILENSILKSVSAFSYLISTPAALQSE